MSGTEERGYRVIKKAVPAKKVPIKKAVNRASAVARVARNEPESSLTSLGNWVEERKASMRPAAAAARSQQFKNVPEPAATPHPVDTHHGGTYPMFLTADEIKDQFQALDADRENSGYEGDTRMNSYTATHGTIDTQFDRKINTGQRVPKRYEWHSEPETDDELYDRKYDEADLGGLADRIDQQGFSWRHPVSLANGLNPRETSGDVGSQDKYQVIGGHHRVAVMSQDHPRQFIPVSFHDDIWSARRENKGY